MARALGSCVLKLDKSGQWQLVGPEGIRYVCTNVTMYMYTMRAEGHWDEGPGQRARRLCTRHGCRLKGVHMCIHASTNDLRDRLSSETENAGTVETPMRVCNWIFVCTIVGLQQRVHLFLVSPLCPWDHPVHAKDRKYLLIRP